MPLIRCGSVIVRFTVWFSRTSASRNWSSVTSSGSMPPGSSAVIPASPRTSCSDARFFELDAANAAHDFTVHRLERRIHRAKHERAEKTDAGETLADDVPRERLEIDDDVRKLGQPLQTSAPLLLQPIGDLLAR